MRIHRYQTEYEIRNAVCNDTDIEQLRTYTTRNIPMDEISDCNLSACKAALLIYDERIFRLWSTPYLQLKVDEGKDRFIELYKDELQKR